MNVRRRSYSACISSTNGSPERSASTAANWAEVGAHMIPYWCTLAMPAITGAGAATQPIRQPVMA